MLGGGGGKYIGKLIGGRQARQKMGTAINKKGDCLYLGR